MNAFQRNRPLHGFQNRVLVRRSLVSNGAGESAFRHPDQPVRIRLELRRLRVRLGAIENICDRLGLSRRERRDVDQRFMRSLFGRGDDRAGIRMSNQDDGPVRSLHHTLQSRDVFRKRCEGNRRTRDFKALFSQRQNNLVPARAVSPGAMDQHDCGFPSKGTHNEAPFTARNSFMTAAISTTCVSNAKWPVSRNSTRAAGMSRRKASAPAGRKNGSFFPQIARNGG